MHNKFLSALTGLSTMGLFWTQSVPASSAQAQTETANTQSTISAPGELHPQQATMDSRPAEGRLLNGQVTQSATKENSEANTDKQATNLVEPDKVDPLSGHGTDGSQIRIEASQGLVIRGPVTITINGQTPLRVLNFAGANRLSAEECRKLEYGIIGVIVTATPPLDNDLKITHLLADCPAELAGMQEGDIVLQAGNHVFNRGDGQKEFWQVVGGKAGTPVDIKVLRNGEKLTFHLTRMNIEDLKDDNMRHVFEAMLSELGPPKP